MAGTLARCPFSQYKSVLNHPALVGSLSRTTIDTCPFLKRISTSVQHTTDAPTPSPFPASPLPPFNEQTAFTPRKAPTPSPSDPMELVVEEPFCGPMLVDKNAVKKVDILRAESSIRASKPTKEEDLYKADFMSALDKIKEEGRYRVFNDIERKVGSFPEATWYPSTNFPGRDTASGSSEVEKDVTVWCSNDYLGMGQNKEVLRAMNDALVKYGAGSGGTRNISGSTRLHSTLENELADLHGKDRGLVFGSCYTANMAAIQALSTILPGLVVFSDEKNHSSIIEGIRHARVERRIFAHNDVLHLEKLLMEFPDVPKLIIFESIYSMDGSVAPIARICDLAKRFKALTFIDEVHAVGLYGERGAGVAEEQNVMSRVDIISGTFGKAYGLYGGYLAANYHIIDAIRSVAPGFIFTTSLPPCVVAGALASVQILKKDNAIRIKQKERVQKLKALLREARLPIMETRSHIVPLMVGHAVTCKKMSDYLLAKHGIYVQPINYPTVPRGSERFRLTTTPYHTDKQIAHLVSSFVDAWKTFGLNFGAYAKK